jgi:catechol 2,3-dioxygenase-like lactoylglutathione lyase family enzyme
LLALFLLALLLGSVCVSRGEITAVGPIGLVVQDLDREVTFFTHVLPFEKVGQSEAHGKELDRLYGLSGVQIRRANLKLGNETVSLTEFVAPKGRPIPTDSQSFDHWFQHLAIVVRDMDSAYAVLAKSHVRHVSTAPQTLPLSNPNAGGIRAFYFQDPEGHVLELIWFPKDKGDPRWQQPTDRLFLGIDHTAIVVSDTDRSLAFYRDALGLRVAGGAENFGIEQEHLNQVFGARLKITALRAPNGPGVEFLEYIAPPGGRPLPDDAALNDALAWTISCVDTTPEQTLSRVATARGSVQTRDDDRSIVRDPDRHALLLTRGPVTGGD